MKLCDDRPDEVLADIFKTSFQLDDTLCDCSIKVDGKVFRAHRAVLSAVSSYFCTMFTAEMLEHEKGEVNLQNTDAELFEKLLKYMYTGRIEINSDNILDLFRASDFFQIPAIKEDCIYFLMHWITPGTVVNIWKTATLSFQCSDLVEACCLFISKNLVSISKTDSFLDLSAEDVLELISLVRKTAQPEDEQAFTDCDPTRHLFLSDPRIFALDATRLLGTSLIIFEAGLIWLKKDESRVAHTEKILGVVKLPLLSSQCINRMENDDTVTLTLKDFVNKSNPSNSEASESSTKAGLSEKKGSSKAGLSKPSKTSAAGPSSAGPPNAGPPNAGPFGSRPLSAGQPNAGPSNTEPIQQQAYSRSIYGLRSCGRIDLKLDPGRDGVSGIAWLNNKIYVACDKSDKISVYTDEKPFRRLKEDYINIPEMKSPDDMIGSNEHQALYLIDNLWQATPEASASCASNLWKVTLPEKKATKWPVVDGSAKCLSFNSKGEVMIFVDVDCRFTYNYIDIYRSSDGRRLRIDVPLMLVHGGLENTNGNFLIFRLTAGLLSTETDFYEVGVDEKVVNKWPLKFDIGPLYRMVLVGDDEVLLCLVEDQMVTLFNMKTKRARHLLSKDQMKRPYTLCYVKDKEQLIVGQRLGLDRTRKVNYSIQFYECL